MTYYSGRDLANAFRIVRKNTVQIASDIPEDKYSFRATQDTRTVGEILAHVAAQTTWVQKMHGVDKRAHVTFENFGAYMQEVGAIEAGLKSKSAIVKALETNGA